MEDSLFLNTKLYGGFKGIIGRRDFFLNCVKVYSIDLFFRIPFIAWGLNKIAEPDFVPFKTPLKWFFAAPILINVLFLLGSIITIILILSNAFRRIHDIQGSINKIFPIIFMLIHVGASFTFLFPNTLIGNLLLLINTILFFVILFMKGKVTSKYPYDFTKEFNWGAFFGSWIWGLINKTYITLWSFIIALTPWSIYFALYCGLKGNEWAYKNEKWNDVEKFNESQKKQATVFTIIFGAVMPIIYSILFPCVLLVIIFFALSQPPKTSGHITYTKSESFGYNIDNIIINSAKEVFDSYKIEKNENKFYIKETDWKQYDFDNRKKILDLAAQFSARKKRKIVKNKGTHIESYSKYTELNKTKIYGTESNKLLAEYKLDTKPNMRFQDIVKEAFIAYKFYNP